MLPSPHGLIQALWGARMGKEDTALHLAIPWSGKPAGITWPDPNTGRCLRTPPPLPQHPPPQNPAVSRPKDKQVGVDQVSLSSWQLRGVKVFSVRRPGVSAAKSSPHTQPGAHRGQHRSPSCLPFVVLFLSFSRLL